MAISSAANNNLIATDHSAKCGYFINVPIRLGTDNERPVFKTGLYGSNHRETSDKREPIIKANDASIGLQNTVMAP